jgi:oligosaccharide repeat unit polymerase
MTDFTDFVLFLNALLYGGTVLWIWRHKRPNLLGLYVVGLYALSSFAAFVFFKVSFLASVYTEVSSWMLLYLYGSLLLLCWPFILFPDACPNDWHPMNTVLWERVLLGIMVVYALLTLFRLPSIIEEIRNFSQMDSMEMVYYEHRWGVGHFRPLQAFEGLVTIAISSFSKIVMFGFFYFLTCQGKRGHKILGAFCCLAPLGECIVTAGRMGIVTFLIDALFLLILFRRLMTSKTWKAIRVIGLVFALLLAAYVGRVTIDRFAYRSSHGAWESVLNYSGQPMLNFSHYVPAAKAHSLGDNTFPLLRRMLGFGNMATRDLYREKWLREIDIPLNVFYTIVGDFCIDFSEIPTFLIILLVSYGFTTALRHRPGHASLHQFFLVYILFLCVGQGMFYFTMKTMGGNLRLFICLGFYVWMRLALSKSDDKKICMNPN